MNKRLIIVACSGALLLILIVVGIIFLTERKSALSLPVTKHTAAIVGNAEAKQREAGPPAAPVKSVGGLWVRPPAKVAARNVRRCRLGSTLRPFGASDSTLERIADGDIQTAASELMQRAKAGDASAANQLGYIAHWTCGFARIDGAQSALHASEMRDAQGLAAADADWIRTAIVERETFNQQLSSVCQQSIDNGEVDAWVATSASRGNMESHYALAMFGARKERDAQLVAAAQGGVPWAQFGLAQRILQGAAPASGISNTSENAKDLLNAAAVDLPQAESYLAQCEFRGCADIPVDIPSALTDARDAAERGEFDAMLEIGPQLQASQIDPDEVEAWSLIHAAIDVQGYAGNRISVAMVKSASGTLNSPTVTSHAKALAEQYWQEYGARIMTSLGCGGVVAASGDKL